MVTGEAVLVLDRECYPKNPLTPEQLNKAILAPNWIVATECSGKSYVILECTSKDNLVIRRVGTAKGSRRLGLAQGLLEPLKVYNCEAVVREDNLPGLKLLQSQGFKSVGLEKGKWGEVDGVRMERSKVSEKVSD